ncbi:MAG TPA: hypothetical protein ENH19_01225 [Actinobacteria bacterium]|nr:hypothetical protein [Actinomycetes bacterium]HEX21257.1 hypothetical protein [Actinomycetota bacterium]
MGKYLLLDLSSGLMIGLIYMGIFWAAHQLQKRISGSFKVLFIFLGFILRILVVLAAVELVVSVMKFDLIYVLAGFLVAHTLWLIFLFVKQLFFSRGSTAIN